MMKKILAQTLMVSALMVGTSAMASAPVQAVPMGQQQRFQVQNATLDFTLHNATGYDIEGIYISPSDADEWGDNLLEETFEDGSSIPWVFSPQATATQWDLRVDWADDEDGTFVYWRHLNLDKIVSMTLHYDEDTDKTSATFNDAGGEGDEEEEE